MFVLPTVCEIDILAWLSHDAAMKKRDLDAVYRAFGNLVRRGREGRDLSQEKLGNLWDSQEPRSPTSKRSDTASPYINYWRSLER
jgi:hypothetical protein